MRNGRAGWAWTAMTAASVTVAVVLAAVGASRAQAPPAKGKLAARNKGNNHVPVPIKKAMPNAADPLANPAVNPFEKDTLSSDYHFKFRLRSFDGTSLATTFYPSRLKTSAPVVMMIHEKDRSSKDFEDSILDLKNQGFAEHLQAQGYAVLTLDLRGQGANRGQDRRPPSAQDWRRMLEDFQAAYTFLIDRNNRGQLNVGKFGVLAMGEGANLVAAWAAAPGGAVSIEGRTTDLSALVLISPMADVAMLPVGDKDREIQLVSLLNKLAPRIPLLLMVGGNDPVSGDPVRKARPFVERPQFRRNLVKLFDSKLHGWKLLRYEPHATADILSFLERSIKFKVAEWEPRYNLNPVVVADIVTLRNTKATVLPAAKPKETSPEKEKEKEAPKAK